jgi:hypothetical protein
VEYSLLVGYILSRVLWHVDKQDCVCGQANATEHKRAQPVIPWPSVFGKISCSAVVSCQVKIDNAGAVVVQTLND